MYLHVHLKDLESKNIFWRWGESWSHKSFKIEGSVINIADWEEMKKGLLINWGACVISFQLLWQNTYSKQFKRGKVCSGSVSEVLSLIHWSHLFYASDEAEYVVEQNCLRQGGQKQREHVEGSGYKIYITSMGVSSWHTTSSYVPPPKVSTISE